MAYLTEAQLRAMGFQSLGKGVKISDRASIYDADKIEIGDYSRIDDFCVVSGRVQIGRYCHVTPMCLIAGGMPGIQIGDFCTFAYGVKIFSQSDDYSGATLVNSTIPRKFKNEKFEKVMIERQVIVGAGSTIFPGVIIAEGCAIGAMGLVTRSTQPWGIYVGSPARRLKARSQELLQLESQLLAEQSK